MKRLRFKETSIHVNLDSFTYVDADSLGTVRNEICFSISSSFVDGELLAQIFPSCKFVLNKTKLVSTVTVPVPTMADMFNAFVIASEDLGKTVKEASTKWLINILYLNNLLAINLDGWDIVDE